MLTPRDVIAGARITAHPNAYVVGCFGTRITFYAQQVRALELAHALQHEHLVPAGARIVVIGGGAAGTMLAAALALQGGLPGPEIEGKARPTFLVSGNGDGGLIDLLAAGSRAFSHEAVIRSIAQRPGVRALSTRLLEIDARARAAEVRGEGFDFIAAYDAEIGDDADRLGLIDGMRRQLRPGVQLFLLTRKPELLSIRTAQLNRLAVYLMVKACERAEREHFDHVVCGDARVLQPSSGAASAMIEFDCGGRVIAADWATGRYGPASDRIREPFAALLAGHAAEHDAWVRRFPEDSIAPEPAPATRTHFARLARSAGILPPRYRLEEMRAAMPVRVKLSVTDDSVRWSGDLAVDDVAHAWSGDAPPLQFAVTADPGALGRPLAHAVARLTIHAPRAQLILDIARWRPFLEALSISSPNAGDLVLPELHAAGGDASILGATVSAPEVLAGRSASDAVDEGTRRLAVLQRDASALAELLSDLAGQVGHDDETCPVCMTHFPPGRLQELARVSGRPGRAPCR